MIDRPATSVQAMAHQHKPLFVPTIGDQDRFQRKFETMRNQREIGHLRSVWPIDQEDAARRIGIVFGERPDSEPRVLVPVC